MKEGRFKVALGAIALLCSCAFFCGGGTEVPSDVRFASDQAVDSQQTDLKQTEGRFVSQIVLESTGHCSRW